MNGLGSDVLGLQTAQQQARETPSLSPTTTEDDESDSTAKRRNNQRGLQEQPILGWLILVLPTDMIGLPTVIMMNCRMSLFYQT
jgi:hypothetical protein